MEKSGEDIQLEFPFTVATVPYRDAGTQLAEITYGKDICTCMYCVTSVILDYDVIHLVVQSWCQMSLESPITS